MQHDEMVDEDGLDDHDRSRASDMEERPIYPRIFEPDTPPINEEETQPDEVEA